RNRGQPVEKMLRSHMVHEQIILGRIGIDVRRKMKDDVDGRSRFAAHDVLHQIAVHQAQAERLVGVQRFGFERGRGWFHETDEGRGAEIRDDAADEAPADEAGRAGHEKSRPKGRGRAHFRRKMKTRGWSNNRNVSSASSSLMARPNSEGYTLNVVTSWNPRRPANRSR